jgi:hypothetical protein
MLLQVVIFALGAHAPAQYLGGTLRNLAFIGMGGAVLTGGGRERPWLTGTDGDAG